MKKRILIIIAVTVILLGISIIAFFLIRNNNQDFKADNLYDCNSIEQVETYLSDNSITHDEYGGTLNVYNYQVFGYSSYSVVDYDETTGTVSRIESYMTFEDNLQIEEICKNLKKSFLEYINAEGVDYVYSPIGEDESTVTHDDFLNGNASMEIFIEQDGATYDLVCNVVDAKLSVRIEKVF